MSKMSDLVLDIQYIQQDLEAGRLSFAEIAAKYGIPISWVEYILKEYGELDPNYLDSDSDYLDSDCHLSQVE